MTEKLAVGFAMALAIVGDGWYCWHIVAGPISPSLATWLIFAIASTVSLASYLKHNDEKKPFIANLANRYDPIVVWTIVAFIVFSPKSDMSLCRFDIGCLVASGLILIVWAVTRSAITANLLIQLVMVAAYIPTFFRLLHGGRNTESFLMWEANLAVAALFLIPPIRRGDWLAVVYASRAIVCVAGIIAVMAYLQFFMPR